MSESMLSNGPLNEKFHPMGELCPVLDYPFSSALIYVATKSLQREGASLSPIFPGKSKSSHELHILLLHFCKMHINIALSPPASPFIKINQLM